MLGRILVTVQIAGLVWLWVAGPLLPATATAWLPLTAGVGLGCWAIAVMGIGRFRIVPAVQPHARLVRSGPYRLLRHPMYSALLLVAASLLIDSFSRQRLAAFCLLAVDLVVKLLYEERLLGRHFAGYSAYMERSWRLVPFLW